jgi:hypothetical protein
MQTNYIFIDFENVQPRNIELLANHPFKIYLFVGASQTKVSFDLASTMQELGESGKYIKIAGNGPNALDFHIAYYIGEFAAKESKANFHIISKDKGFDPLISHLKTREISVQRYNDLAEIPMLRAANSTSSDEKISTIVSNLTNRGQSRPRKVKTLQNTINILFTSKLDNQELQQIIHEHQEQKYIVVKDGNVTYNLKKKR